MTAAASIRLADYTPWAFELPFIVLDVNIQDDHVVVTSRLSLEPRRPGEPLVLRGVDLAIESLVIDQAPLSPEEYSFAEGRLTCLLYTSPSPRDLSTSRMPSSA